MVAAKTSAISPLLDSFTREVAISWMTSGRKVLKYEYNVREGSDPKVCYRNAMSRGLLYRSANRSS